MRSFLLAIANYSFKRVKLYGDLLVQEIKDLSEEDIRAIMQMKDAAGRTIMHYLVMHASEPDLLSAVITLKADLEARDNTGHTPLLFAAVHDLAGIPGFLVSLGVNKNAINSAGKGYAAIKCDYTRRPLGLLRTGLFDQIAHPTKLPSDIALLDRFEGETEEAWKIRVLAANITTHREGFDKDNVELRIALVNARTYDSKTPLQFAAEHGRKEWVEALLSMGAHPGLVALPITYNKGVKADIQKTINELIEVKQKEFASREKAELDLLLSNLRMADSAVESIAPYSPLTNTQRVLSAVSVASTDSSPASTTTTITERDPMPVVDSEGVQRQLFTGVYNINQAASAAERW
jgi:hypothetical protein